MGSIGGGSLSTTMLAQLTGTDELGIGQRGTRKSVFCSISNGELHEGAKLRVFLLFALPLSLERDTLIILYDARAQIIFAEATKATFPPEQRSMKMDAFTFTATTQGGSSLLHSCRDGPKRCISREAMSHSWHSSEGVPAGCSSYVASPPVCYIHALST